MDLKRVQLRVVTISVILANMCCELCKNCDSITITCTNHNNLISDNYSKGIRDVDFPVPELIKEKLDLSINFFALNAFKPTHRLCILRPRLTKLQKIPLVYNKIKNTSRVTLPFDVKLFLLKPSRMILEDNNCKVTALEIINPQTLRDNYSEPEVDCMKNPGENGDQGDYKFVAKNSASDLTAWGSYLVYGAGFLVGYLIVILPAITLFCCCRRRISLSHQAKIEVNEANSIHLLPLLENDSILNDCPGRQSTPVYEELSFYKTPPPPRPYWPFGGGSVSTDPQVENPNPADGTPEPVYQNLNSAKEEIIY